MSKLLTNVRRHFTTKKMEGSDQLIIAIVLIAVGVGLSIYFRNQIYTLITSAVSSLTTSLTSLFSGTVSGS